MRGADEQQKLARCRHMRRWRKRLSIAFLPLGFVLMVGLQIAFARTLLLAWPVLLGYTLGVMIWLNQLDSCPWCHQSFHTSNRRTDAAAFKSLLWRDHCANCGKPDPAAEPPTKPAPTA
ncbi:MAG: hypothetical protein V2J89_17185 [Halieaceae bacterium]|jgi:hypothetical protein|nr:hypothetical protein [Halieaceae bacterium]